MNINTAEEALPSPEPTEVEITSLLQQLAERNFPEPTDQPKKE